VPGLEIPPRGLAPARWETWALDQDVDAMPRFSLRVLLSGGAPMATWAGSGSNAPTFDQVLEFSPGVEMELGYSLAPSLELVLRYSFFMLSGQDWYFGDTAGHSYYTEFDDWGVFGFGLGLKLRFPFGYDTSRLLRFGKAEVPDGLQAYLSFGAGLALHTELWVEYENAIGGWNEASYFESGTHPFFFASLGLEYRWTHFALLLEFGACNLGSPNESSDPAWSGASNAADLVVFGFQLGLGIYF